MNIIEELNQQRINRIGESEAFPITDDRGIQAFGLSKKEYIAIQILSGLIHGNDNLDVESKVKLSLTYTDELIKQLYTNNK